MLLEQQKFIHCKVLAPKLARAAKSLESVGVKIGAVDVEPNRGVQSKFPDIRGFPSLKFIPSAKGKGIDYNGAREEEPIVEFSKEQAKKAGAVLGEAVPSKGLSELFTFFGRAGLDRKPALFLVGGKGDSSPPPFLGKVAAELRKQTGGTDPEAKTKSLLTEAASITKVESVKDGLASLLDALEAAQKAGIMGPPVVSPGFTSDDAAAEAFGLSAEQRPALIFAAVSSPQPKSLQASLLFAVRCVR